MGPFQSKLKNKKLHSQTNEVVYNVIKFMENEAREGSFTIPVGKAHERASTMTGISFLILRKLKKEGVSAEDMRTSFKTSDKRRENHMKPISDTNNFNADVIRRAVYEFYKTEKKVPTVFGLRAKLSNSMGFHHGGNTSLRKMLK